LQGQAKEAAKLISLLGSSTCLGDPRLQGQIQPDARTGKERFQITADAKPCNGAPTAAKMTPASDASATGKHDADTPDAPKKTDAANAAKPDAPKKNVPVMDARGKQRTQQQQQQQQQRAMHKDPSHGGN
jgi:general secretion pathway protein L